MWKRTDMCRDIWKDRNRALLVYILFSSVSWLVERHESHDRERAVE